MNKKLNPPKNIRNGWFKKHLRHKIKKRERLYATFVKTPESSDLNRFKPLRKSLNKALKKIVSGRTANSGIG